MDYDQRVLGQIIKKLRIERGLSQDVLSGLAGIGRTHLTMIETGKKKANVETLWRIADALNLPLSHLIKLLENELSSKPDR